MGSEIPVPGYQNSITSFSGDYAFLSNFYPVTITVENIPFPTVEHAFQAAKTHNLGAKSEIAMAQTPGAAKRMGRKVELRHDWENVRIDVMESLLKKKFLGKSEENETLLEMLLDTYPERLIEGNNWGDTFWGKVIVDGLYRGENHLGRLLMKIRRQAFYGHH